MSTKKESCVVVIDWQGICTVGIPNSEIGEKPERIKGIVYAEIDLPVESHSNPIISFPASDEIISDLTEYLKKERDIDEVIDEIKEIVKGHLA